MVGSQKEEVLDQGLNQIENGTNHSKRPANIPSVVLVSIF